MRVVSKFALAFFFVSCALFTGFAYVLAGLEAARLRDSVQRDLASLGEVLTAMQGADIHMLPVRLPTARAQSVEPQALRWSWEEQFAPPIVIDRGSSGDEVQVSVQVRLASGAMRTLRLKRLVPNEVMILQASAGTDLVFMLILAIALALVALGLGQWVIGGPLSRIVAHARKVGLGDRSGRLRQGGNDEIGALKRELNSMFDLVETSRKQLEVESEARLDTLQQLRHLDRLRTVGTIAASLAHELGTPLNVVLLKAQALELDTPEEVAVSGGVIVRQVEKMARIVRALLDFGRRPNMLVDKRVDLLQLLKASVDLLDGVARKQQVELRIESTETGWCVGRVTELEQALTNLLVNGIQAMRKGGLIRLTLTWHSQAVREQQRSSDRNERVSPPNTYRDCWCIEVIDQGVGLGREQIDQLFEPFYTTKAAGEGTGLGLSVAQGIAEDHGGWISVTSELGIGSTFSLFLPEAP